MTTRLSAVEIESLDPYNLFAVLGKRVIHPGGKHSTEQLFEAAQLQPGESVLDVGCGVGTTAIEAARRFGAQVTAIDIADIMVERTQANVRAAGLKEHVRVAKGDILALDHPDASFDCVIAEAVTMFVDRAKAISELVRVCKPGGRVLATEFFWRTPPTPEAHSVFLTEVCPGMQVDNRDDWVRLYESQGLSGVEVTTGPFEMMTMRGVLADEGFNTLRVGANAVSRPVYLKRIRWLMPRMSRAAPYLGYIAIVGKKAAARTGR